MTQNLSKIWGAPYHFPKKAIKADCPACGRKKLSRYVDRRTDEPLPNVYGRCDRATNCAYDFSPYHKGPSGLSYADEVYEQWKAGNPMISRATDHRRSQRDSNTQNISEGRFLGSYSQQNVASNTLSADRPIYTIPDPVFNQSLGHYDRNQLARLLRQHFGMGVANELLQRFQIGTSGRWPGATVFWYIDEQGRKRGGQIKLFGPDWHTVKYVDYTGEKRTKTSWVHSALIRRYCAAKTAVPHWLTEYDKQADRSPCLFGLPQLLTAPTDQPVAIVEAPKTAMLCTPYFPQFIWLAVGALSYLTTNTDAGLQRLAPLKGRQVALFPDLSKDGSSFARWSRIANELGQQGFNVTVSDYLEKWATTDQQRQAGLDLADWLLDESNGYPPDWDQPTLRDAIPTIRVQTLHEWQQVVCNSVPSILPSITLPKL